MDKRRKLVSDVFEELCKIIYDNRVWIVLLLWLFTVLFSFKYGYRRGSEVTDAELDSIIEKLRTEAEASSREVERLSEQLKRIQGTTERITESNNRAAGFIDRASENIGTATGGTEAVVKDLSGVREEMQQYLEESESSRSTER